VNCVLHVQRTGESCRSTDGCGRPATQPDDRHQPIPVTTAQLWLAEFDMISDPTVITRTPIEFEVEYPVVDPTWTVNVFVAVR
jgi:hypothetical protein